MRWDLDQNLPPALIPNAKLSGEITAVYKHENCLLLADSNGMVQIRDPSQQNFPEIVEQQVIWTQPIANELKPKNGNLESLLVIPVHGSPIIFAGSPSGNIITHKINNTPKAFSAHTDTDKVFGTMQQPNSNFKVMANKQLREVYKDVTLLMQIPNTGKIISFSKGGLLRQWYLNEETIPSVYAPQNH